MPEQGCLSTACTLAICSFLELILDFMVHVSASDKNLTYFTLSEIGAHV